jgi:hypothetical protein
MKTERKNTELRRRVKHARAGAVSIAVQTRETREAVDELMSKAKLEDERVIFDLSDVVKMAKEVFPAKAFMKTDWLKEPVFEQET